MAVIELTVAKGQTKAGYKMAKRYRECGLNLVFRSRLTGRYVKTELASIALAHFDNPKKHIRVEVLLDKNQN